MGSIKGLTEAFKKLGSVSFISGKAMRDNFDSIINNETKRQNLACKLSACGASNDFIAMLEAEAKIRTMHTSRSYHGELGYLTQRVINLVSSGIRIDNINIKLL